MTALMGMTLDDESVCIRRKRFI